MSIKNLDVSDPSKLSQDELRYAFDRYMICEEEFLEYKSDEDEGADDYDNKRKWSGKKLQERAVDLGLNPEDYSDRDGLVGAIRAAEAG